MSLYHHNPTGCSSKSAVRRVGFFIASIVGAAACLMTNAGFAVDEPVVADEAVLQAAPVQAVEQAAAANAAVVAQDPGQTPMPTPAEGQPVVTPTGAATPGATAPGSTDAKPGDAGTVKRPTAEKYVPQPINQEIRKNPNGKVSFSIKGQPWEPVLQWLADGSALSLDWQELPGDSLNLITSRDYTMEEARDLINRHLLSRGFTMIVSGEVMSIVRTKELNPALVARVTPDQLKTMPEHTICKVSFDLDWLIADEAVEELKPMLSSAGQIHKLSRTNRLEVVDTAGSLRQIWDLIENEQSTDGEEQLVRAFRLQHRRAEDAIRMLRELLNLKDSGNDGGEQGGMDPNMAAQMMQQMQQQMQAMQQAAAQAAGGAGGSSLRKTVETRLVLNARENMILAQAAPDQMAVIEKAVEQIDVEKIGEGSLIQNINRMKIYRLDSVDPQTLADLLQQLGELDPQTVLKVDKQKRSIIAWASLADHLTITTLVERMDQSSRKIEVIPLRRLDAEYVAGTIRLLMGKEEPKEENPFMSRYQFFGMDQMNQQSTPEPSFKVEADTENNRLLVNANNIEMDEIRDLLMKLGELPDPNAATDGIRVFELNSDEDLQQLQKQLQRYWRRGNRLQFDLPEPEAKPRDDADSGNAEPKESDSTSLSNPEKITTTQADPSARGSRTFSSRRVNVWPLKKKAATATEHASQRFDQLLEEVQQVPHDAVASNGNGSRMEAVLTTMPDEQNASKKPKIRKDLLEKLRKQIDASPETQDEEPDSRTEPERKADSEGESKSSAPTTEDAIPRAKVDDNSAPVRISMTPDGKLIVSSDDPEALMEMEDLMSQIATPRRGFKVFTLKYATPSWVTLNLKDFFKAEEETKSTMEYSPYWGLMPSEKKVKGNRSLSRRRQPQFISDNFTSTILVRDADAKQLQTIEDLIAIYDVPEPSDSRSMRVTTIFRLRNAKASIVAAAVKDVFRDLLSSNDKALEKDDKNQQRQSSGLVTFLPGSEKKDGEDDEEPIRFKGLLSMGIDDSSNTLIVSSSGSLMETVGELIEQLDEAADSSSVVQVVKVDKSVDLALIKQRLDELMGASKEKNQPPQPGQPVPGQPGMPVPGQPVPGDVGESAAAPASE